MIAVSQKKIPLALITFCLLFQSCSYSKKAAGKLLEEAKTTSYDVIVVPGVPFNTPNWDRVMKGRVYWSKYLFDLGIAKNIMYSGSSVYTAYNEAQIMALYAAALGIPQKNIFTETHAEHSTENIYYSYKKSKKTGFNTIALASDQFQTKSLRKFAHKKIDVKIGLIPWYMPIIKQLDSAMVTPEIDYKKAYNDSFISIKKREGFWKRLRGTRGKNLNTTLYE